MGRGEDGFTLVEALVALLVLGIAAAGLLTASDRHVDRVRALEVRAVAELVAANRAAELQLPGEGGEGQRAVDFMGRRWTVSTVARATDDPDLLRYEVTVGDPETGPVLSRDAFAERAP